MLNGVFSMNLKDYNFDSKEAFIYYIQHLVIIISRALERYEKQIVELQEFIEKNKIAENPEVICSADKYENFKCMLGFSCNYLSNLFGDQAKFGTSYQNYRKNVKKRGGEFDMKHVEFSQEQEQELNQVTTLRDWANHVPVSLINSTMVKSFETKIDTQKPIFIAEFNNYEGMWLITLYDQNSELLQGYKRLFELLKQDYKKLTGSPCIVVKNEIPVRSISDLQIPKISYEIQNKKIKSNQEIQSFYKSN